MKDGARLSGHHRLRCVTRGPRFDCCVVSNLHLKVLFAAARNNATKSGSLNTGRQFHSFLFDIPRIYRDHDWKFVNTECVKKSLDHAGGFRE